MACERAKAKMSCLRYDYQISKSINKMQICRPIAQCVASESAVRRVDY